MPLYEYKCEKCGDIFEVRQKFSDEPLTTHETCGGPVHRILSAPALQFKGSGWYITDYARGGSKGESKSESKTETKKDSNGAKSPESKSSDSGPAKTESKSDSSTKQ